VLSALGMLVAPPARQLSRTRTGLLYEIDAATIEQELAALQAQGRNELHAEGARDVDITCSYSLDLRYQGQSYTLNLPWQGLQATAAAFERLHEQRYGHRLDTPVELVNVRCGLHGRPADIELPVLAAGVASPPARSTRAVGCAAAVPVYARTTLLPGQRFAGPALVTETVATTWLPAGWQCEVDRLGNLLLEQL